MSTTDSPIDHAFELFEKKRNEDPAAANKALAEALGGNRWDEAFVEEINNLRRDVSSTNDQFVKLDEVLGRLDAEKLPSPDGRIVEWQPQWRAIRGSYIETVSASRQLAMSVADRVGAFINVVIPKLKQDSLTAQEKDEMLKHFLGENANTTNDREALTRDEIEAESLVKRFMSCREGVGSFTAKFNSYFQMSEEQLNREMMELQERIKQLEAELASDAERWRNLGLLGAGAIAAPVFPVLGALDSLGAGNGALQAQIAERQRALRDAREELYRRLDRLHQAGNSGREIIPLVTYTNNNIGGVIDKLVDLMTYWRATLVEARSNVEQALNDNVPSFIKVHYLDLMTESYKKVQIFVKMYAEGFDGAM